METKLSGSKLFGIFAILILITLSCQNNQVASPKPKAYPRVVFPEKNYKVHEFKDCSFKFQLPSYAKVEKDSMFFDDMVINPCWFNINFPQFNGMIHCSYYEISDQKKLDSLIFDSFSLVGKHTSKAQFIDEQVLELPGKGGGILFKLSGPVASPTQFFVTDSTDHFLRGALYFNNKVQLDSMGIIYDFVNEDIDKMLQSFYWN